jgi:hypothetical protein
MTAFSLILSIFSSALHGLDLSLFQLHSHRLNGLPVQQSAKVRTHFFEDIVNGESYLEVSKNCVVPGRQIHCDNFNDSIFSMMGLRPISRLQFVIT